MPQAPAVAAGLLCRAYPPRDIGALGPPVTRRSRSGGFFVRGFMPNNPKDRVAFFIDGFNLYHSLPVCGEFRQYRWLDLRRLAECFYSPRRIEQIIYFTAYAAWSRSKTKRHRTYIQAQRNRGVAVEIGEFHKLKKRCRAGCKRTYWTHEEKQTDVNIAIKLLES